MKWENISSSVHPGNGKVVESIEMFPEHLDKDLHIVIKAVFFKVLSSTSSLEKDSGISTKQISALLCFGCV